MTDTPRLRPREHGAYAMLTFPVLSGLVLGGISWAGAAFALMAAACFLAHEPVLIVLGGRGERLRSSHDLSARRRLLRLGLVVAAATVVFVVMAPGGAWPPALLSGVLAALVGVLLLIGRTRTLAGELLVACAFASVHGTVAASGAAGQRAVFLPVAVWAASFAVATLAVHALKFRFKGRGPGRWTVAAAPTLAGALVVVAAMGLVAGHPLGGLAVALVPKAAVVLALAAVAVHPRHLKRVGWSLVVADTATLAILAGWAGS